jgi:hypothetical protein
MRRRYSMKIMIEVSGGVVCNIVATQECSIYLVDHDDIKMRIEGEANDPLLDAKESMQPYFVSYEEGEENTPIFDEHLNDALSDYQQQDWVKLSLIGGKNEQERAY